MVTPSWCSFKDDKRKLFYDNARRILGLKDPAPAKPQREPALA